MTNASASPFSGLLMALVLTIGAEAAHAQSDASRASAASIKSLSVLPAASMEFVAAGGALTVAALRPVGHAFEVVLHGAAASAEVTVLVSTETARGVSLAVGSGVRVVAVSAGFLLVAPGEAIAFIPDALAASLVHRREIHR